MKTTNFKKDNYTLIRKAVNKELVIFLYNYFLMKKQVYDTCLKARYVSPFEEVFGIYENKAAQVPETFSLYADSAMETLMLKIQPLMEKNTGLKLNPSYTYGRVYKKGDILYRHKDRFNCEISATMNLGGDDWPIWLDPTGECGILSGRDQTVVLKKNSNKGIKVNLKPGDMLVYRGCDLEHWREKLKGKQCVQIFLHYNDVKTKGADKKIFDSKIHLGLPPWFKGRTP